MVVEETSREEQTENEIDETNGKDAPTDGAQETEEEAEPFASAKDIPRAPTSLYAPPATDVSDLTVSLVSNIEFAPALAEIAAANEQESDSKTPLMAVIHAVLADAGGTMSIKDLAVHARQYWNRPFPTSPYSPEEFIYVTVRASDDLRVNE